MKPLTDFDPATYGLAQLQQRAKLIASLPQLRRKEHLSEDILRQLLIDQEPAQKLTVYFAPFDWINERARVVICGITPGRDSMERALLEAGAAIREGAPIDAAARRGKSTGSFSNMRVLLAQRLDAIGLHKALRIPSTAEFWQTRPDLLHPTSVVRYPTFCDGGNYGGYSPPLWSTPFLLKYPRRFLSYELQHFDRPLIVPLGKSVWKALQELGVDERHLLVGFPHASSGPGAQDRAVAFEQEKRQLAEKVRLWAEDAL